MATRTRFCIFISVFVLLAWLSQVWAAETRLAGVKIGSSPKDVLKVYGDPNGMLVRQNNGMVSYVGMRESGVWGSMSTGAVTGAIGAPENTYPTPTGPGPLPSPINMGDAGGGVMPTGATAGVQLPGWAMPVRIESLGPGQVEWLYDKTVYTSKTAKSSQIGFPFQPELTPVLALGVVITGEGPDAIVTDVIVASFRGDAPARRIAATAKEVRLGDTFAGVIKKYRFPVKFQVFDDTPVSSATAGTSGMESTASMVPPSSPIGYPSAPTGLEMGTMPSMGATPVIPTFAMRKRSLVVNFDDTAKLFTKACVAYYGNISFTFSDMKVARIHIFE